MKTLDLSYHLALNIVIIDLLPLLLQFFWVILTHQGCIKYTF